jgi:hypothetical protein
VQGMLCPRNLFEVPRSSFAWAGPLTSAIITKHLCAASQTPNPVPRDNVL